jgi:hypothetical protein
MATFTAGFVLGGLFIIGMVEIRQYIRRNWVVSIQRVDDSCGCHDSWDDHEAYMLAGTTATTQAPAAEWMDVVGVDGKPSGIKVEVTPDTELRPKSDEDYW